MSATDIFLLVVRWTHLIAATAWVGGSLFYWLVLRPVQRKAPDQFRPINALSATEFKGVVDTSILVLLVTGAILTLNRLTPGVVGAPYVVVLGLKIALAIWMFAIAWGRRKRSALLDEFQERQPQPITTYGKVLRWFSGYNVLVILGIAVFLLSDLLKVLFELALGQ